MNWPVSPSVPFREPPPKQERSTSTPPELKHLRSALFAIPNGVGCSLDYDDWFHLACAVHYATGGSDEGLALFEEFSAQSPKHDSDFLAARIWPYIQTERGGEVITERTIYHLAGEHGWQDPSIADDFEVLAPVPRETANAKGKYHFVKAAQFAAGAPPGWIIKGVLPRQELAVIYGESGAGKSFMTLDLLGHIVEGRDWRGHRTAKGLTAGYIAAEGAAGFRLRLDAFSKHHNATLEGLAVLAGAPNFMKADEIGEVIAAVREYGRLDVLVVDTLAQVTAGADENSGEDMGRVIAHCKTLHAVTGATIVLIHHSGKDASRGARGWSGIKGALDAEIEITRSGDERAMTITKLKDGKGEGASFAFKLVDVPLGMDEDNDVFGSCVVEHIDTPVVTKGGPKGRHETTVYRIVLDLLDADGWAMQTDVLAEFMSRTPLIGGRDTRPGQCNTALRGLADRGLLRFEGLKVRPVDSADA